MKHIYKILGVVILLTYSNITLFASVDEAEVKQKLALLMGQNNSGTDYWFTIPPAYMDESVGYYNFIKVLVASPVQSDVTVEIKGKNFSQTKKTLPDNVIEFLLPPEIAQVIQHTGNEGPVPAKVYKAAGIHVFSDAPIIVYVVVKVKYTTDGFLAIPSSALGTQYINMVYQEPNFKASNGKLGLSAPFTGVTAAYDNTQINFTMGGGPQGNDAVPLDNGQLIHTGEQTSQTLNQGDVWLLSINDYYQDLSGSLFSGNYPFSIVSGIQCANFPIGNHWCDYSVEMESPIYSWGTHYYITPMEDRKYNGIIRIFASEDNTTVYRDDEILTTIPKGGGGTIGNAYFETRVWPKVDANGITIAPKIATIHADKPISVMYYNTGTEEDESNGNSDPFMMLFTPVEQYGHQIYFASPNATGGMDPFQSNYINLVFQMNGNDIPDDLLYADLSAPQPIWKKVKDVFGPSFDVFNVPFMGMTFAYKTLSLPVEGVYGLKSTTTLFAGYSYGFSPYESYGFPTAAIFNNMQQIDPIAPEITYTGEKDADYISGSIDDSHKGSSGLSQFYMLKNLSSNYEFEITSVDKGVTVNSQNENIFIPGVTKKLNWSLTKQDNNKEAYATLYVSDRSGNDKLLFFGKTIAQTSIENESSLSEYMTVTPTEITVLPQALSDGFAELSIFNLSGTKLSGSQLHNTKNISLANLQSGTYIITLKSDKRILTRKINIVR